MYRKKIAIACQGGGSHTAFTAGVLNSFFEKKVHLDHEIVSFSGTSGGAVCASLAWYYLLTQNLGETQYLSGGDNLEAFWLDNSAQNWIEEVLNSTLVRYLRYVDQAMLPHWKGSASDPMNKAFIDFSKTMLPGFYNLKYLLEKYIKFNELERLVEVDSPVLIVGAASVLSGEFKKFSSLKKEIKVESILASSAVPSIFPAVVIDDDAYWDGLFSDNPPTDELIDPDFVGKERKPDELWVIQINPQRCNKIPTTVEEIIDRRNEMTGNQSLEQDLKHIKKINQYIEEGVFSEEYIKKNHLKKIDVFKVTMSDELLNSLDYTSKLDRSSQHIQRLLKDGKERGHLLLKNPELMRYN